MKRTQKPTPAPSDTPRPYTGPHAPQPPHAKESAYVIGSEGSPVNVQDEKSFDPTRRR